MLSKVVQYSKSLFTWAITYARMRAMEDIYIAGHNNGFPYIGKIKGGENQVGLRRKVREAIKPVLLTEEEQQKLANGEVQTLKPGRDRPTSEVLEVKETPDDKQTEYTTMEVKGSNGKTYKIVIPKSYYKAVPKTWEWNEKRYKVADMIAAGYPITEICRTLDIPSRQVIYGWLQHPEFKEHVDGLILETGWANKQERIAGLKKVTELLFKKVVNEIDQVKLTDKSIGAVLSSIQMIAKQLGVEKEELVEQSKVEQNTTVSGSLGIVTANVDSLLNAKTAEEKAQLEREFNELGDSFIRNITGEKD